MKITRGFRQVGLVPKSAQKITRAVIFSKSSMDLSQLIPEFCFEMLVRLRYSINLIKLLSNLVFIPFGMHTHTHQDFYFYVIYE